MIRPSLYNTNDNTRQLITNPIKAIPGHRPIVIQSGLTILPRHQARHVAHWHATNFAHLVDAPVPNIALQ